MTNQTQQQEVPELVEHIREQITHVEQRIADGKELGATVWRLTLEDVARENRAVLATLELRSPSPGGEALADIAAERRRQIDAEGWTPEHDDKHSNGEMAAAAAAYAFCAATSERYYAADPLGFWPWDASWWKPSTDRRNLIKAGALIVAEIERLDRKALNTGSADND
jgi:hypothetical protein